MTETPGTPEGHEPTTPLPPHSGAADQPGVPPLPPPPAGYGQAPGYGQNPYAPGYGMPAYGASPQAPWGLEPGTNAPYSDKSKTTAGLLQLLLSIVGLPGIGHLYVGRTSIGLIQLVGTIAGWLLVCVVIGIPVVIGLWVWGVVDGILMLTGRPLDAAGRPLRP